MKYSVRIFALACFICIAVILIITPYGTLAGQSMTLLQKMNPDPKVDFSGPFVPFALMIPVIITLISFVVRFPFPLYLRFFFSLLFIGAFISLIMLMLLSAFMSANGVHDAICFYAFGSSLWCLFLAIPATSKWKWIRWPFSDKV